MSRLSSNSGHIGPKRLVFVTLIAFILVSNSCSLPGVWQPTDASRPTAPAQATSAPTLAGTAPSPPKGPKERRPRPGRRLPRR